MHGGVLGSAVGPPSPTHSHCRPSQNVCEAAAIARSHPRLMAWRIVPVRVATSLRAMKHRPLTANPSHATDLLALSAHSM